MAMAGVDGMKRHDIQRNQRTRLAGAALFWLFSREPRRVPAGIWLLPVMAVVAALGIVFGLLSGSYAIVFDGVYSLADGARVIVRPSGTEPKVKCYLEVVEATDGDLAAVPQAVGHSLYRTAQEALTNVTRHSTAQRARVTVRVDASYAEVEVTDDGRTRPGTSGTAISSKAATSPARPITAIRMRRAAAPVRSMITVVPSGAPARLPTTNGSDAVSLRASAPGPSSARARTASSAAITSASQARPCST